MQYNPTICASEGCFSAKLRHPHESIAATASAAPSEGRAVTALLPIMAVVLIAFLIIGFALPILPLHVHQGLGLSSFVVGLVAGSRFAASLVSRVWSGQYADSRGVKRAVVTGLLLAAVAGLLGGAKVALVCVLIEAAGLTLIWLAPDRVFAAIGAALAGLGFSLVYPGLGVEAVRRASPQNRGLAMGAYTVFLDVALGFGSPALGMIAVWSGLGSVFLAGALIVLCGAAITMKLLKMAPPQPAER